MIVLLVTAASLTTYAVFTAAPITLANNTITTGSANAAVCDTEVGKWKSSITSALVISSLIPGEENEKELTEGKRIFLGNDDGYLNYIDDTCPTYDGSAGLSDTALRFVPKVTFISCSENAKDDIGLDFDMGEGLRSGYKSMREWEANLDQFGPIYHKNEALPISIYGALDIASQLQNTSCQFDVVFHGQQAHEED